MTTAKEALASGSSNWQERLLGVQSMIVDEWSTDESPCEIFWKPSTLSQRDKIFKYIADNSLEGLAESIVQRVLDADGKKMFTQIHKKELMTRQDPDVLIRIVSAMNEDETVTIEEARKNSE
jgi:hypothetical protein